MSKTIAIVFAAGKGTRMRPFTETTPKPLAKIGNQTLLEFNLEKLSILADEFVIIVNWLGEQIIQKIGNSFNAKPVLYAWQINPAGGTLDALRTGLQKKANEVQSLSKNSSNQQFRQILNAWKNENVTLQILKEKKFRYIISNSDNICGDKFYSELKIQIQNQPNQACLTGVTIEDSEVLKEFGVFRINQQSFLQEIVEKSPVFVSNLGNAGLYYFPENLVDFIPPATNSAEAEKSENKVSNSKPNKEATKLKITTEDREQEELITDLFNEYNKKNPIKILPITDLYLPISSLTDLKKVNAGQ